MESGKDGGDRADVRHPFMVYLMAFCATIGGFLFGYDTGIINGAILLLQKEYSLGPTWVEGIVSSCIGAAAIFSFFSGIIADAVGRKVSIMMTSVVFTVGALLMGVANGPEMILIGRITVGAAIGVVSAVVPVYVAECSPSDIRGRLVTVHQLCITIGIWISSIFAGAFQELDEGWRYMLGLGALPGILQFVLFFWLPESPRYQMMKGDLEKARATLLSLRSTDDVTNEMNAIQATIDEEENNKGFDVRMAIWLSVIPLSVNFLATFIGLWAVETMGRRKVLSASFLAIAFSLLVLAAGFFPTWVNSPHTGLENEPGLGEDGVCSSYSDGRCSQGGNGTNAMSGGDGLRYTFGYCPTDYSWLAVLGCMLFVLGFAPGNMTIIIYM
ncbi:proton myo-inositol cotransporter [Elysia marginata]|uniref:Proton myo-inositol cotransporter n=1 Tax=Elysia marginata TaxID=1093978 RepID=A0AAV4FSV3_9GAST|nr:proton myo-inositol cotransporter [Elysia marginata]